MSGRKLSRQPYLAHLAQGSIHDTLYRGRDKHVKEWHNFVDHLRRHKVRRQDLHINIVIAHALELSFDAQRKVRDVSFRCAVRLEVWKRAASCDT